MPQVTTPISTPCPACGAEAGHKCKGESALDGALLMQCDPTQIPAHIKRWGFPFDIHLMLNKTQEGIARWAIAQPDGNIYFVEVEPDGVVHQLNKANEWDGVMRISWWPPYTKVYEILSEGPPPKLERIGMAQGRRREEWVWPA